MNPFDLGMVQPSCFYSYHNRNLIDKEEQNFQHIGNQALYYNPCWTLMGDFASSKTYIESKRNGGTYYFVEKKSKKLYWYLIDQIIMRKSLIEEFNSEYLKVIENQNYIDEVLKPKIKVGNKFIPKLDYLPIKFSFNFKTK